MVSTHILSNYDSQKGKCVSLFDWIGKVKCKKTEMRRKRRQQDLRVAAILTRALIRAEQEMRIKQQERALKWAKLNLDMTSHHVLKTAEEEEKHNKEVSEIWNSDLSQLDDFLNSLNQIKTSVVR